MGTSNKRPDEYILRTYQVRTGVRSVGQRNATKRGNKYGGLPLKALFRTTAGATGTTTGATYGRFSHGTYESILIHHASLADRSPTTTTQPLQKTSNHDPNVCKAELLNSTGPGAAEITHAHRFTEFPGRKHHQKRTKKRRTNTQAEGRDEMRPLLVASVII